MEQKKTILITGCSSGIGLATAIECGKSGHHVIAILRSLTNRDKLDNQIKDNNLEKNIDIFELDISQLESIKNFVNKITEKYQKIDILFNNAGFMTLGSLEDVTADEIYSQIKIGRAHV